jgi:hypothetical protein
MRFPAGKQSALHKEIHPSEVLNTVETGYIRLTVENGGLTDHYILYQNNEVVGALNEFSDGRRLYSEEALDYIFSLDDKVLAQTVEYTEDVLDRIKKDHPEIFLAPESTERFKIGDTIFTGTLCAVKSGDLLTVINQLTGEALVGCLRITRETEEAVQEGGVIFLETPVAAVFESRESILLGDDALREIALAYTHGRVYKLDREFIDKFLFLNNASRLKIPVEETITSEKARDDLKRFMVLQMLELDRGTLVLNAPCNGTFSFEALLKSAASRSFDGYLWVRSDDSRGLMVMGQGKIQAAYSTDTSGEAQGAEALKRIYGSMESRGTVDFYQLSVPPRVTQSFETEETTDDILVRKLIGEMGQDLIKDVSVAKEFKKRWKDKRKELGE